MGRYGRDTRVELVVSETLFFFAYTNLYDKKISFGKSPRGIRNLIFGFRSITGYSDIY